MDSQEPDLSNAETAGELDSETKLPSEALKGEFQAPIPSNSSSGSMALRPYDFRRPSFLSAGETRRLRAQYDEFLRGLGTRLTNYLRLEFESKLQSLDTLSFQAFAEALPQPTHLTLFKVEPLRGICVIELDTLLALAVFDRLMGGTGQGASQGRELSDIEAALIDHVVQIVLDHWCAHCGKPQNCKPVLLGHETDSRYLQTSPPETMMFVAAIEATLGQICGRIQIAFPLTTLDPFIRQLRENTQGVAAAPAEIVSPKPVQWNRALEELKISIVAELPSLPTPARAIARLKIGDVVPLPAEFAHRVQLRLGGLARFTGRLGTREGQWAVEVTSLVKNQPAAC